MEKLTDKYLWKSLKEGDLNAFAVLFETYYPLPILIRHLMM